MPIDPADLGDFLGAVVELCLFWPGPAPAKGVKFPDGFQIPPTEVKAFSGALPGWHIKPLRGTPGAMGSLTESFEDGIRGSGTWHLTPGAFHAHCGARTKFEVLEGQVTVISDQGDENSPISGGTFWAEAGTAAVWEVQSPSVLRFTLEEPAEPQLTW